MAFDYKKEYKDFYTPPKRPGIVTIPAMSFIAVRGRGDPNAEDGDYQRALKLLYAIAFTIKMSRRSGHLMDGYFDYVVPPLEGFWWQPGVDGVDYAHKEHFEWISAIRVPDFVTEAEFGWAIEEATHKKRTDFSPVEFMRLEEGLCVQCLHVGPYDDEPATIALMHEFARSKGYRPDLSDTRRHHEIYLSDARRVAPERLRTVIRHLLAHSASTPSTGGDHVLL
ncbi:GyrI-like domain-containing protein [Actinomyces sp.]|uniref:GyrI-like domain-containing protein n=1 Tax=Actinomyces sp. TaxID=29317 RepID=UPI0026DAF9D4|nr:GyrI-like domain-containing protein [Actinomyces sp.]MDO4900356.1 GyrI-like domain-containing protein [Actinomyces sp.]